MFKLPPFLLFLLGIITGLALGYSIFPYFNFATSVIPGWHTTVFPPYFMPGLILSGLAFFQVLLILVRQVFKFQEHISADHIEGVNKLILGTSLFVLLTWIWACANAWYSGYFYEQLAFYQRVFGHFWWTYYGLMCCNLITPQIFWWPRIRRHIGWTLGICLLINIGAYFERLAVIFTAMMRIAPPIF